MVPFPPPLKDDLVIFKTQYGLDVHIDVGKRQALNQAFLPAIAIRGDRCGDCTPFLR
jgi:hypothetical protein